MHGNFAYAYLHSCMRAVICTAEIDALVIHGGCNDGHTNKHMNTRTYDRLMVIFLRSRCALESVAAGARQVEAVTSSIGGVQRAGRTAAYTPRRLWLASLTVVGS